MCVQLLVPLQVELCLASRDAAAMCEKGFRRQRLGARGRRGPEMTTGASGCMYCVQNCSSDGAAVTSSRCPGGWKDPGGQGTGLASPPDLWVGAAAALSVLCRLGACWLALL